MRSNSSAPPAPRLRFSTPAAAAWRRTLGFEKDKYDVSQKIGERVLLPAVRNNPEAIIVSDGFSCCEQITQNTKARPKHLAEVLAEASDNA